MGGLVGGFDWWVGLGGFTIISDFHATFGSGETVKRKRKWMRFSFFGSFDNAVVITSLYLSSLLFSFLLIITTRFCRRVGGWEVGWVGGWAGGWIWLGGFGWVGLGGWVWVGLGGFTI